MTITKERRQRHAMRALRLEIFTEIEKLDKLRCDKCRGMLGPSATVDLMRCKCYAATKIREIGKKLNGVTE